MSLYWVRMHRRWKGNKGTLPFFFRPELSPETGGSWSASSGNQFPYILFTFQQCCRSEAINFGSGSCLPGHYGYGFDYSGVSHPDPFCIYSSYWCLSNPTIFFEFLGISFWFAKLSSKCTNLISWLVKFHLYLKICLFSCIFTSRGLILDDPDPTCPFLLDPTSW